MFTTEVALWASYDLKKEPHSVLWVMCFSTNFCACVSQALGGLAYQALYQRILSAASTTQAQVTCYAAALPFFIMGIPSVAIAAAAASAGNLLSGIVALGGTPLESGKADTEGGRTHFLCQMKNQRTAL